MTASAIRKSVCIVKKRFVEITFKASHFYFFKKKSVTDGNLKPSTDTNVYNIFICLEDKALPLVKTIS